MIHDDIPVQQIVNILKHFETHDMANIFHSQEKHEKVMKVFRMPSYFGVEWTLEWNGEKAKIEVK